MTSQSIFTLLMNKSRQQTFPIGVPQRLHPEDIDGNESVAIQNTVDNIIKTRVYMETIMTNPKFASIRLTCQNHDEYCASLASDGYCNKPENYDELVAKDYELSEDDEDATDPRLYDFMMDECAPACQRCENFIEEEDASIIKDCVHNPEENIFESGDLNKMFEYIVGESSEGDVLVPKEHVRILSRPNHPRNSKDHPADYQLGPWIVTLEYFLTDDECDRLIELGQKNGYERSGLEEEKDYNEEEMDKELYSEHAYRTSTNTWCMNECYEDELTQKVIKKLSNATGIPHAYSEHLQLLSYVPGEYYKEHHDIGGDEFYHPPASRIITFFLYLNDVEEGGETRFTDLTGDNGGVSIDVQPKKGRALIWPNVLDDDLLKMDKRTYHEALPLIKGRKFGANAWFYLRKFQDDNCEYDTFESLDESEDAPDHQEPIVEQSLEMLGEL